MGASVNMLQMLSVVGAATGGITSAGGAYFGAKSDRQQLAYQAQTADLNAQMAEQSAQETLMAGQQRVGTLTLRAGQVEGSQRAAMAANGVDLGVGSAKEVAVSTKMLKNIDVAQITSNAISNAWGYRTSAINYKTTAKMDRASRLNISPLAFGATSLIGSASSVASMYYNYRTSNRISS